MIAVLTILIAVPIGYLVRSRLAGNVAYGLAFAHVFTLQTAVLVMDWANGGASTFPHSDNMLTASVSYLVVTTAIYAAGFGLVAVGHLLRQRRETRRGAMALSTAR
jgi:hypothetical protein